MPKNGSVISRLKKRLQNKVRNKKMRERER